MTANFGSIQESLEVISGETPSAKREDDFVLLRPDPYPAEPAIPLPGTAHDRNPVLDRINEVLAAHRLPLWSARQLGAAGHCRITDLLGATTLNPGRVELNLKIALPNDTEASTKLRVGGRFVFVVPVIGTPRLGGGGNADLERHVHLVARSRLEGRMDGTSWLKIFTPEIASQVERQFVVNGLSWEVPRGLVMDFDETRERDPRQSPAHKVLEAVFGDAYTDSLEWAAVMPIGEHLIKGQFSMARIFYLEAASYEPVAANACRDHFIRLPLKKLVQALNKLTGIADSESVAVLASAILKAPAGMFG